jgi:hypothetical protein
MKPCFMNLAGLPVALLLSVMSFSQGRVNVTVDPAGEHFRVFLSYLDAAEKESFADVFRSPFEMEWKPYSLVLNNVSGKAIIALNIRWMATSGSQIGFYDSSIDSILPGMPGGTASSMRLMLPGQDRSIQAPVSIGGSNSKAQGPQVATKGERMLVAPGLFVRESARRLSGGSGIPREIKEAETISAILDAVILEDGEVLGPDASHTVDSLRKRRANIDTVLKAVMAAEQNGQDGVEVLRQFANPSRMPENVQESMQLSAFVRSLMTSPDWRVRLEKLSEVYMPNFHR